MTATRGRAPSRSSPSTNTTALTELKSRPPTLRPGLVERDQLVARLQSARDTPVITIVAPAGYGKTVLMAQWVSGESRPWAWVSLDKSDDDPANLLSGIAAALGLAGMLGPDAGPASHFTSGSAISHGVPRLIRALAPDSGQGILVLDNFEALRKRDSIDVLGAVIHQLAGRLQVVVASRSELRLPIAALRTRAEVLEFTAQDLALSEQGVELVLQAGGIHTGYDLAEVMERTEGWPVGAYLTGLAMRVGATPTEALSVGGDDLYIAEYLRNEILDHLSESRVSFLTRTSVLDQLSGSLCDAVLGTSGSGRVLEELERSNLLIMRLDRTREWHRYHRMFQELLQAELRLREPEAVAELHARAAEWFEAREMLETAIHHAQAADDPERVARLVVRAARATFARGRSATLLEWLDWLDHRGEIGREPGVAAIGALACVLAGDPVGVERWAIPDDASDPVARLARALQARSGTHSMIEELQEARNGLEPGSGWLPGIAAAEGLAWLWEREVERADTLFAEAVLLGEPLNATPTVTFAMAERAVIAIGAGDWSSAEDHARRSLRLARDAGLQGYVTSALGFVVAARLARRRNDIDKARELLAQAASLRPRLNTALPGISVQVLIEMAMGYLELSDAAGARLVLRDAQDIVNKYPVGQLPEQLDQVKRELTTTPGRVGSSALTTAELRVLPLLATHLTFPEIGERLFVSRHTVKTQAMSIYRKLGASSRSEAVQVARESGFLGV